MHKLLKTFVLAALLAPLPALAQGVNLQGLQVQPFKAQTVSDIYTAVSTDVGVYVKYVGTAAGTATVAVDAATGDLTFTEDGAASTSFECPVSGALGGIIDVSDTACDTVGEVVDIINTSANWVAVPHSMLRADSSNNTLITLAATSAREERGLGLLKDTAVTLAMSAVLVPKDDTGTALGIRNYLDKDKLIVNPFKDRNTTMLFAHENFTTTDNAGNLFKVFCVVPKFKENGNSTETATEIYREALAATTVTGKIDEFINAGGLTCNGGKLLVRANGNTTFTAPTFFATGFLSSQPQ